MAYAAAEQAELDLESRSEDGRLLPGNCGIVTVAGNRLTLFEGSAPLMKAMERDIRGARMRAWVEAYIFADDDAGRAIADALMDRARAGLDVRVMYDAIGSYSTPSKLFDDMREAGVKVHAYLTFREAWRRSSLWQMWNVLRLMNRRNHRKLTVIDDRVGYFGGMNVVDQSGLNSEDDSRARQLPRSAGWRDLHVRAEGPVQEEVVAAFDRLWRRVHRQRGPRWPKVDVRPQLRDPRDSVACYDLRPSLKDRRAARVFLPLLRQARRSITLSMAYFVPVGRVLRELLRARRRGVTVRVIVPGKNDVPAVQRALRHFYSTLLKHGIRIFERKDQMLHSKVMVVDDEWTMVGSCNLDPRSLRLNLEFLSVIHSRDMARAVNRVIRFDLRNSRKVRLADCTRRGWWDRLLDRIAWSCRALL